MARSNGPALEHAPHAHGRLVAPEPPSAQGGAAGQPTGQSYAPPQYAHPQYAQPQYAQPQHAPAQQPQHANLQYAPASYGAQAHVPAASDPYRQGTPSGLQWPPQIADHGEAGYGHGAASAGQQRAAALSQYTQPQRTQQAPASYAPGPSYAPQFDRYTPPGAPASSPAGGYAEPLIDPAVRSQMTVAQSTARGHGAELRGGVYDQYRASPDLRSADPRAHAGMARQPDPSGYDFGSYMPAPSYDQRSGQAAQPDAHALEQWSGHDAYADGQRGHAQAGSNAAYGHLQPAQDAGGHDDQAEYDDGAEEPPRKRRGLLVVGALIGAIGLGGVMAYGYKSFLAPKTGKGGTPPVVRKEAAPAKTKPADPGGRQFANQDSKLLGKLGDDATRPASASGSDSDGGVRRVATVPVGRDGTFLAAPPPATTAPSVPAAPAAAPVVPGMILDNSLRGAAPQPPAPPAPPVTPRVVSAPATPQSPVLPAPVPRASAPAGAVAAPAIEAPASPPPAARATKAVPKVAKARDDFAAAGAQATTTAAVQPASAPAAAASPAAPKAGITGYMPVLASPKSRIEALKTFADLQQKYPDLLGAKTPEVQESDQSARGLGTIYRVMVGPPGSREAAASLCQQLRSAGHGGCWVTGF